MIKNLIQLSFLTVVTDITLFLFLIFNSTLASKRKFRFLLAAGISLMMVGCNSVIYAFEGAGTHIGLLKFCEALSYSISGPVFLPFVFLGEVIGKRVRFILQACATCNIILSFCSIATGWIFRIDEMGNITLGPLSPIPFYFSAMYLSVLLASSLIKFRVGLRSESLFILFLTINIIAAVVMNTVFHFKYLISGMATLSCVFYYMFFTAQTLTRDAMTNALNRHSFYKDIKTFQKKQMFVIAMDLNGLKQLNDTQGHSAGDKAIVSVAETAAELLPVRCRIYRMGGDEFEILYPNVDESEVTELVNKLKEGVQKKGYSVAIGFGEYERGMDFDEVFKVVDAMMYADKARMKNAMAKSKLQVPQTVS